MRQALHEAAADLSAKGAVGRERVRRLHDAMRNSCELAELVKAVSGEGRPLRQS